MPITERESKQMNDLEQSGNSSIKSLENKQELHFYTSRVKSFFWLILGFVFIAFGALISVAAWIERDYLISVLGICLSVFFAFLCFAVLKRLRKPRPYLVLTDEELIINPSKHTIPIKWEDIQSFRKREAHFNKFLEIVLYNEDEYRALMSNRTRRFNKPNDMLNLSPFALYLSNIKRKERDKVVRELDRRTVRWSYKIYDQMEDERIEESRHREIDG